MKVSIVILNWNHPEVIDVCLRHLDAFKDGYPHEIVVVDNGSTQDVVHALGVHYQEGRIDKVVPLAENRLYSGGFNAGIPATDPESEYILCLNSDVAVRRADWLTKLVAWIEGRMVARPNPWCVYPTVPKPGPFDILSAGWSHDVNVQPGRVRPEGFCLMIRRSVWRDFDETMPWFYGWEHTVSEMVRDGARCGVLFNYAPYFIHRECASGPPPVHDNLRTPDLATWFAGLEIETLDFTLGPDEHSTYMEW